MKDPRQDPNKILIRLWALMVPAEREALVEYFSEKPSVMSLALTLTKWSDEWTEELRVQAGVDAKTGKKDSNIIPFRKGKKK